MDAESHFEYDNPSPSQELPVWVVGEEDIGYEGEESDEQQIGRIRRLLNLPEVSDLCDPVEISQEKGRVLQEYRAMCEARIKARGAGYVDRNRTRWEDHLRSRQETSDEPLPKSEQIKRSLLIQRMKRFGKIEDAEQYINCLEESDPYFHYHYVQFLRGSRAENLDYLASQITPEELRTAIERLRILGFTVHEWSLRMRRNIDDLVFVAQMDESIIERTCSELNGYFFIMDYSNGRALDDTGDLDSDSAWLMDILHRGYLSPEQKCRLDLVKRYSPFTENMLLTFDSNGRVSHEVCTLSAIFTQKDEEIRRILDVLPIIEDMVAFTTQEDFSRSYSMRLFTKNIIALESMGLLPIIKDLVNRGVDCRNMYALISRELKEHDTRKKIERAHEIINNPQKYAWVVLLGQMEHEAQFSIESIVQLDDLLEREKDNINNLFILLEALNEDVDQEYQVDPTLVFGLSRDRELFIYDDVIYRILSRMVYDYDASKTNSGKLAAIVRGYLFRGSDGYVGSSGNLVEQDLPFAAFLARRKNDLLAEFRFEGPTAHAVELMLQGKIPLSTERMRYWVSSCSNLVDVDPKLMSTKLDVLSNHNLVHYLKLKSRDILPLDTWDARYKGLALLLSQTSDQVATFFGDYKGDLVSATDESGLVTLNFVNAAVADYPSSFHRLHELFNDTLLLSFPPHEQTFWRVYAVLSPPCAYSCFNRSKTL